MGLFGLFKKKSDETKVGNVEDFISLTRVYFQSVIATNLGITNIRFFRTWLTSNVCLKCLHKTVNWDWVRSPPHAKC